MNCVTPGFLVLHYLSEFIQTHVLWVDDAVQPSHPLSPSSALNISQHQGLFQWVGSSHQVSSSHWRAGIADDCDILVYIAMAGNISCFSSNRATKHIQEGHLLSLCPKWVWWSLEDLRQVCRMLCVGAFWVQPQVLRLSLSVTCNLNPYKHRFPASCRVLTGPLGFPGPVRLMVRISGVFSWDLGCRGAKLTTSNISLACVLFWAENNQGPKDSGRTFDLPLTA